MALALRSVRKVPFTETSPNSIKLIHYRFATGIPPKPPLVYTYWINCSARARDSAMAAESALAARFFGVPQVQPVRRDLVELGVGYALIPATVWTANPT